MPGQRFVPDGYSGRGKFARLTRQEERADLLDRANIGRLRDWQQLPAECGYGLRGSLPRSSDGRRLKLPRKMRRGPATGSGPPAARAA